MPLLLYHSLLPQTLPKVQSWKIRTTATATQTLSFWASLPTPAYRHPSLSSSSSCTWSLWWGMYSSSWQSTLIQGSIPLCTFFSATSLSWISVSQQTLCPRCWWIYFRRQSISYVGCLVQMYFFMAFGNTDSYLLASMAIDRLVAICNPFHYDVVMNPRRCLLMLVVSCTISHLHSLLRVLLMSRLSFCGSHVIKHYFCDTQPVLKLSCSDTSSSQLVVLTETLAVISTPFLCILFSYLRIIITVLRIPSAAGKWKAFSTCGSHLTVVALFYGSIIYVYFRPLSMYSVVKDRVATVMYTVVTPMLNPFIYSLRNKDMKRGLKKLKDRIHS